MSWATIKTGYQWAKKNLIFIGTVLFSVLLAFATFWKRKATSLETQLETQEKRADVKRAHEETRRAEEHYEQQKKLADQSMRDYNDKYRSGKGE